MARSYTVGANGIPVQPERAKEQSEWRRRKRKRKKQQKRSLGVTKEDLWAVQKILNCRKGRLSAIGRPTRRSEDNVGSWSLGVCVCATIEEAWANPVNENSEGDILYAEARWAMDGFARGQQHQARCQDEVKGCRESLGAIVRDLTNFRALLEVAFDDLADAGMKTTDMKRKADDAHDGTCSHRACSGSQQQLGDLVKDTASAVFWTGTIMRRSTCMRPLNNWRVLEPHFLAFIWRSRWATNHGCNSSGEAATTPCGTVRWERKWPGRTLP